MFMIGINHIYTNHDTEWISYDEILSFIFNKLSITDLFLIDKFREMMLLQSSFSECLNQTETYFRENNSLIEVDKIFQGFDFSFVDQKILTNFDTLYIYNNNINLWIDFLILSYLKIEHYFHFINYEEVLNLLKSNDNVLNARNVIFFDHYLENMLKYDKFNPWFCLLTTQIFSYKEICDNDVSASIRYNIDTINDNPSVIHFTTQYFYQLRMFLCTLLQKTNNLYLNKNDILNNYLTANQTQIVLVINRTLFKKSEFSKAELFISDTDILFKYHIGGNNIEINGNFNSVLAKVSGPNDIWKYTTFWENLKNFEKEHPEVDFINTVDNLDIFTEKTKMIKYFQYFSKLSCIQQIISRFGHGLEIPQTFFYKLSELSKESIFDILSKNEMTFPLIIKFESEETSFFHKFYIILNNKGFSTFLENTQTLPKGILEI